MANDKIGFIGLGVMGLPMSKNLLKAGYSLVVHDIVRQAVDEVAGEGAETATSCKEVAQRSDIVITMLPDSPDVEMVVDGPDGVFEGISAGKIIIDMSTISPVTSQRLAARAAEMDVVMLDAPVSGGQAGAIAGSLSIMVGGDEATFNKVLPILDVMGKTIVLMGDAGAGQVTKACNQIVVAETIWAVGEALVLATKAGVDPAKVRQVLMGGYCQSRIMELHGQKMLDRDFAAGFRIRLHHKDLGIALSAGKEYGVPLLVAATLHEVMGAMKLTERGELDHSALVNFIEDLAQVEVKPLDS